MAAARRPGHPRPVPAGPAWRATSCAVSGDLASALDGSILCAHNVEFDWPFLVRGLRRARHPPPDALRLCTLQLSRSLDPERTAIPPPRATCAPRYGVALTRAHDAAADAAATAALLPRLLDEAGITDLAELAAVPGRHHDGWPVASAS